MILLRAEILHACRFEIGMRLRYDNVESITWDIQKGTVAQAQSLSFKIKLDSRKAQVGRDGSLA
jgi:hypothetical protein